MNSINTNLSALTAQQNMQKQNKELDEAMARLSSGLRINSAADDAAGSAIASKMEAQVRSLDVAIRNSYDAISMTQTVEGALGEMENILQRVRELSVQASNSTLSASDRKMIQSEVDALVSEIDTIAGNTHFNNVKLLDGSNSEVSFQIGINADTSLKVNLENSDSTSLGLSGATGVTTLTSSRVLKTNLTNTPIATSDIKINGFDAFSTAFNANLSTATDTAKKVADAINLNTGVHGAEANAFNTFTTKAMGTFNMAAAFTINGESVALASSYTDLVNNINEAVDGVTAILNSDNTITISNTTGNDITMNGGADVGFGGSNVTYAGFVELTNLDSSDVIIEAGSVKNGYTGGAGTIADVQAIGFNEFSVGGVLETDTVSGTALTSNQIKINDILIGESLTGAANHIADAINKKTSEHGVTADAQSEIELTFNYGAGPSSATNFKINGQAVDLTSASSAANVVTLVNSANIGDIRASANSDGTVKLSSDSGVDIVVANADNDMLVSAKDIHGNSIVDGFSNGVYDLDGLVAGHTMAAVASQAIDVSGSTLLNEVVNSRIVLTYNTVDAYSDGATTEGVTVRGTDADGNNISENILFGTGNKAIGDQTFGTTIFHTVTSVENFGTPEAAPSLTIGFAGSEVKGNLHSVTSAEAAGAISLNGALASSDINGFIKITHAENATQTYAISGIGFNGEVVTETMTLAAATNTTTTSKELYRSVTSITAGGTTAATLDIGVTTVNETALHTVSAATAAGTLTLSVTGGNETYKENLGGAKVLVRSLTGDYSGNNAVNFTVTGTDQFGATQTEVITHDKVTGKSHGNLIFDSITSIATDKVLQSQGIDIGIVKTGDRVEAKGNMLLTNADKTPIKIQAVGDDTNTNLTAATGSIDTVLQKLGVLNQSQSFEVTGQGVSVGTETQANSSLAKIDKALDQLSLFRSSFGAVENRIDASINNLTTLKVNTEAAKSRIQDADFAAETSKMTKSQILSQAATSMLAQANASKQNLLALLQG